MKSREALDFAFSKIIHFPSNKLSIPPVIILEGPIRDIMNDSNSEQAAWVRTALDQHEGSLIRYATSITGDVDVARDVVQDTFIRLCSQSREALDGHLSEWLFTVCRNRALDIKRKESRMTPLTDQDLQSRESHEPPPDIAAQRSDAAESLLQLVGALPANQQEVIRLKFQSGMSYQEISRVTNLTVTNVGFLIHTAVKALRQKLQSHPLE